LAIKQKLSNEVVLDIFRFHDDEGVVLMLGPAVAPQPLQVRPNVYDMSPEGLQQSPWMLLFKCLHCDGTLNHFDHGTVGNIACNLVVGAPSNRNLHHGFIESLKNKQETFLLSLPCSPLQVGMALILMFPTGSGYSKTFVFFIGPIPAKANLVACTVGNCPPHASIKAFLCAWMQNAQGTLVVILTRG
jgi:hypothetical protein